MVIRRSDIAPLLGALAPDAPRPELDEFDLLHWEDKWVALSPREGLVVGLLLERFGRVVSRERLASAVWPGDAQACRAPLSQLLVRVRRRIVGLGLEAATVRGRGYVLRQARAGHHRHVNDRCPSCGRQLGEIVRVVYSGRAVIVRFAVLEGDDERVELEHRCGDDA